MSWLALMLQPAAVTGLLLLMAHIKSLARYIADVEICPRISASALSAAGTDVQLFSSMLQRHLAGIVHSTWVAPAGMRSDTDEWHSDGRGVCLCLC